MNPLVSIIIPAYNVEKYIGKAIQSALTQTYENIEIIVIDDNSTDRTVDVVRSFYDDRIKLLVNERNMGPSHARNRGIKESKGEWIALLDSDDWWEKERLEKLICIAETYQVDVICDNLYLIVDGEEKPWLTLFEYNNFKLSKPSHLSIENFIRHDFGPAKPVIRKAFLYENNLFYDENLWYGEDFVLYLRLLMNGARWYIIPQSYYYYRSREGSLVTDTIKLLKQKLDTTNKILANFDGSLEVLQALLKHRKKIESLLSFYEIKRQVEQGEILKGICELIKSPNVFVLIIERLPYILRYKIIRQIKLSLQNGKT